MQRKNDGGKKIQLWLVNDVIALLIPDWRRLQRFDLDWRRFGASQPLLISAISGKAFAFPDLGDDARFRRYARFARPSPLASTRIPKDLTEVIPSHPNLA
jgi:hypothetical protein